MQELMLGYLLEALDDDERQLVEQKLQEDPSLVQQLEQLRDSLRPLEADNVKIDPPSDLTDQTCRVVAACSAVTPAIQESACRGRGSWRFSDIVVGAGIIAASALLFFPALMQSRLLSQQEDCANNLRELGISLASYSNTNDGYFPQIPSSGNLSAAGIYSVRLQQKGFLPSTHILVCPSSALADQRDTLIVPTIAQLESASCTESRRYRTLMGGSYAFTIGYINEQGFYCPTRNQNRKYFAIMADVLDPSEGGKVSDNHGCCGQNVLLEDGHVVFVSTCHTSDCKDDIFRNDQGQIAAGMHANDAVVAHSAAVPVLYQALIKPQESTIGSQ